MRNSKFCINFVGMNKIIIPLFILATLMLTACGGGSSISIDFEKAKSEQEITLVSDNGAPSCKVCLDVAYAKCDNAETAKAINDAIQKRLFDMQGLNMQQAVDSFARQYTHEYKQTLAPLYEQDKNDETKRRWYEYHYTIDTKTKTGRDNVVVYLINMDYYEGGAHGIEQQLVMNFDALSGQQLTLKDVFVPGYEAKLTELLLEKLMEIADVKTMDELKAKDYLFSMDMFPSENFILDSDEITFIYNAYEIAPYAMGRTEISVSYSEVKDLLKK